VIDHDYNRYAGKFNNILLHEGWLIGSFTLNDSPAGAEAARMPRIGSRISVGYEPVLTVEFEPGVKRHTVTKLHEVSVVDEGGILGAQVISRMELPTETRRSAATLAPRDQVIFGNGEMLIRPGIGRVLRIT
jgi:hypothetical protein